MKMVFKEYILTLPHDETNPENSRRKTLEALQKVSHYLTQTGQRNQVTTSQMFPGVPLLVMVCTQEFMDHFLRAPYLKGCVESVIDIEAAVDGNGPPLERPVAPPRSSKMMGNRHP